LVDWQDAQRQFVPTGRTSVEPHRGQIFCVITGTVERATHSAVGDQPGVS
jgi:hypothetical protein